MITPFIFLFLVELFPLKTTGSFFQLKMPPLFSFNIGNNRLIEKKIKLKE